MARILLRSAAVAIAIAGVVDPAIARRVRAPLAVEFRLPAASHPDFSRAEALRNELAGSIQEIASVDRAVAPHAIVAIGDAEVGAVDGARAFWIPVPDRRPAVAITGVRVPRHTVLGQSAAVTASVRGAGLAGRTSNVVLQLRGSRIGTIQHRWTKEDEAFEARFSFAPPGAGLHRLRMAVSTDGSSEQAAADLAIAVRAEPLRILVFEARPSWPVTFVRRSLEGDALFDVASAVRTSRPVVTQSAGAPASLASLDVDRYDAVMVGSLDELRAPDFEALDRFVGERGGTLILLPDRQIPETLRRRFDLPALDEVLLQKPVDAKGEAASLQASELLLFAPREDHVRSLAAVQHGSVERSVVVVIDRGAGRIVFSGALDAWRYRTAKSGFDKFWRSVAADAALAAPPKLDLTVDPALARPGDTVTVTATVRATEVEQAGSVSRVPPIAAALLSADGREEPVRLWPSSRVGTFEARLRAPADGRYTVATSISGASASAPLLVASDVVHPAQGSNRAAEYASRATGGAVLRDRDELVRALSAIETETHERTSRPMRGPWWIVPFSLLLCVEWALRRRSGLK